jgi:protein required for attachment to host cells
MRVRIVVADQGEARFYDSVAADAPLQLAGRIADPKARLHDRDFKSDRPGRVFDHAPASGARRGSVAHHSTGGERRPHKREAERFARQVAAILAAAEPAGFDRLVLVASPSFLGPLRTSLPKWLRGRVVGEIRKDLVHQQDDAQLRAHLTREMFQP